MLTKNFALLVLSLPAIVFANGTISFTKKTVYLEAKGKKEKRARRGRKVKVGDTIRTAAESYAKITMSDKNIIHVGPNTKMVFQKYASNEAGVEESLLSVVYGKVRTDLDDTNKYDGGQRRFRVTTEAAVLGVRGTDFITEHSQAAQQTRATTLEGVVAVSSLGDDGKLLGEKTLNAGEVMLIQLGQAPLDPIQLPSTVLEDITTASTSNRKSDKLKQAAQNKTAQKLQQNISVQGLRSIELPRTAIPREIVDRNIVSTVNDTAAGESGDATVNFNVVDAI